MHIKKIETVPRRQKDPFKRYNVEIAKTLVSGIKKSAAEKRN